MACRLELACTTDEERRRLVRGALQAYNTSVCPDMQGWEHPAHLDVYLLDSQGQVQGGLLGLRRWRWLAVDIMVVAPELRRQGLGSRVLRLAEAEARRRGCTQVEGHIHGFQAPGFWCALGYSNIGEIADFPPGYAYAWLMKGL